MESARDVEAQRQAALLEELRADDASPLQAEAVKILQDIASTGAYVHQWQLLRPLMTRRLKEVVESYALEEAGYAHDALYTGVNPAAPLTPALPSPITMPVDSARHEAKLAGSGGGGPAGDGVGMDVDKPPPVPPGPESGVVEAGGGGPPSPVPGRAGEGEGEPPDSGSASSALLGSASSALLGSFGPAASVHAPRSVEGGAGAGGHTTPVRPPRPGTFALPSALALDLEELEDELGRFGTAAPWTLQRLCELLSTPRRFYAGSEKLTRALRMCLGRGVSGVQSAVAPWERVVPDPSTHLVYTQLGPLPKPPHDSSMTLRHSLSPGMGEVGEEEAGARQRPRGGRAGFPSSDSGAKGSGRGGAMLGLGHRRPDVMTAGLFDIYGDLGEEGEEGGWEGGLHGGYGGAGVEAAVSVPLLDNSDSDSSDSDEDVGGDETARQMFQNLTAVKVRSGVEGGGKARPSGGAQGSEPADSSRAASIVAGLLAGAMAGSARARTDCAGAGPSSPASVSSGGSKAGSAGGRKRFRSLGDDLDDLNDDIFPLAPSSAAGAAAAEPTLAPRPQSATDMEEDGVFGPRAGAGGAGRWSAGAGPRSSFGVSLKAHEVLGRASSALQLLPVALAASSSASLSNLAGGGDWRPVSAEEGGASGGGWSEVGLEGGAGAAQAAAPLPPAGAGDDPLFRRAASPDLDTAPLPRMASPGLPRFMSRASPVLARPSGEVGRGGAGGEAGRSPLGRLGSSLVAGTSSSPHALMGGSLAWGGTTPSRPSILSPDVAPAPVAAAPLVAYGDTSSSSSSSDYSDDDMGGGGGAGKGGGQSDAAEGHEGEA